MTKTIRTKRKKTVKKKDNTKKLLPCIYMYIYGLSKKNCWSNIPIQLVSFRSKITCRMSWKPKQSDGSFFFLFPNVKYSLPNSLFLPFIVAAISTTTVRNLLFFSLNVQISSQQPKLFPWILLQPSKTCGRDFSLFPKIRSSLRQLRSA